MESPAQADVEKKRATWDALTAVLAQLPAALDHEVLEMAELSYFDYTILAALADGPEEGLPISDLAARTHGSISRTSHTAGRFERAGMLRRYPAPDDGRVTLAAITESGRVQHEELATGVLDLIHAVVIEGLSEDELAGLERAANTIISRLTSIRSAADNARRRHRRSMTAQHPA